MSDSNIVVASQANSIPATPSVADSPFISIPSAGTLPQGNAPVSHSPYNGDTAWLQGLRKNATRQDLAVRYATGRAIAYGLSLSTAGLNVTINPGHALIDGVVELQPTFRALSINSRSRIWLLSNGTITIIVDNDNPPSTSCLYLGAVITNAIKATSVDRSGVMFSRGGILWRETSDTGIPTDNPPSDVQFVTKTLGGRYWWDGQAYTLIGMPATAAVDTVLELSDQMDEQSRLFRLLLMKLVYLFGDEVLTDELIPQYEMACAGL